ncbi:MAG: F0F1 ATP synthase subunit B [Chloroflexaceae bacterium]|nr:F0F1 ATP synthase subunit B [Chloroflexaceae bacterium]
MEALGVNLPKLIYQIINFGIMAFVLYRLLYKPVFNMLQERATRIEQSLKEADQVKEQLANAKRDYDAEIAKARQEAAAILMQAQERVKAQELELINQAQQEAERIRTEARAQTEQERALMFRDAQQQIAEMVTLTAEKVLQAELKQSHNALIEQSLVDLAKSRNN